MITKRDYINLIAESRAALSDERALTFKDMYPEWKAGVEITQEHIDSGKNRYQYNGKLYKAVTAHTTQDDWRPGIETLSLFVLIDVTHAGTIDDPIPAAAGMEYTKGLYYIEGETVYLMSREGMEDGESITLAYLPSQLVGQYFTVV